MRVVRLESSNFKRIHAVDITPTGNLVEISGRNGAGKSSVLDSLYAALAGAEGIPGVPIRRGEDEAIIKLDLGEIKVTRKFKAKDEGGFVTSLTVEDAEGGKFKSPQAMLDKLLSALTIDPLAFTDMPPKEQFDLLRQFVPDVDFEAIERAQANDFSVRAELNRKAKERAGAASQIQVASDAPAEPIDESALVAELEQSGKHNTGVEQTAARRNALLQSVSQAQTRAAELRAEAERSLAKAAEYDAAAGQHIAAAGLLVSVDPIDTAELRQRIEAAKSLNAKYEAKKRRAMLVLEGNDLEHQAEGKTKAMEWREKEKRAKIAAAKLPIQGLSLGNNIVLYNDFPLDQVADSDRLKVSLAIAIAMNPKLKVVRIRDGSLLDEAGLEIVRQMAETADAQVWIELVRSDGKVGIVIEDGAVAQVPA